MKIAATYENGQIFQHFGHTAQFKLYDVENGTVVSAQVVDTNGSGHGALAGFLAANGVDSLICGGIGGGAQMALAEAGIQLYAGCSGDADQCVAHLLAGTLQFAQAATCDHHHGEEHTCGDHGCGSHDHTCGHHCCGNIFPIRSICTRRALKRARLFSPLAQGCSLWRKPPPVAGSFCKGKARKSVDKKWDFR